MRMFRFVPTTTSLDHLIGASEEHRWHFEAKGFRRLEIDTQLEFGGLVKGDVSRIGTFENLVDEVGEAAKNVRSIYRISHQSAHFDIFSNGINCGDAVFSGQFDNRPTIGALLGFFR